jgi:hypothetical protein
MGYCMRHNQSDSKRSDMGAPCSKESGFAQLFERVNAKFATASWLQIIIVHVVRILPTLIRLQSACVPCVTTWNSASDLNRHQDHQFARVEQSGRRLRLKRRCAAKGHLLVGAS